MAMQVMWVDPNDIEDVWVVNNRKEHTGHIDSLAESMTERGYLAEYPIIVFKADGLGISTEKSYVMACGHHRRKGAIKAEIEMVLCEVHDGREEEWIEMMATDNFQFDVASNPGIGLAFTETERRAACRQLLLLPKYLEQTNVSLAGTWNVSEGTIRRWRAEIEKLIKDDSALLTEWNVSTERLERLKGVIALKTRINAEGEAVTTVRKPAVEDIEETRRDFWWKIRSAVLFDRRSDGSTYLDAHGFVLDAFGKYIREHFGVNQDDSFGEVLTIRQLKTVHNWALTDDPDVIARCQEIQAEMDGLADARKDCDTAYEQMRDAVYKHLSPEPESRSWSEANKAVMKHFHKEVARQYDGFDFDDRYKAETLDVITMTTEIFRKITADIEKNASWVKGFKKNHSDSLKQQREQKEKKWHRNREKMFAALEEYPREIDPHTFCTHFDEHCFFEVGTTRNTTSPKGLDNAALESHIWRFNVAVGDIKSDASWVKAIPDKKPLIAVLTQPRITYLRIEVEGGDADMVVEFDTQTAEQFIPPEMYQTFIKVSRGLQIYQDNKESSRDDS